jgi:hypothetical protein
MYSGENLDVGFQARQEFSAIRINVGFGKLGAGE